MTSKVMAASPGTRERTSVIGTGQCAQNTRSQVWPSVHRLSGSGKGRWPTRRSERACRLAWKDGFSQVGQRVIIAAGVPLGTPGATNMLRIAFVAPEAARDAR